MCLSSRTLFPARNYDLAATLTSGQAFRWAQREGAWEGVIGHHWVRLRAAEGGLAAEAAEPCSSWDWLADYLQLELDLDSVLATFPPDPPLRAAIRACYGLRVLRQGPWECLASFIVSSNKQIVQIQQIVSLLSQRFGQPVAAPNGHEAVYAFPAAERLAACSEQELRACQMGFRAPYLRATAQAVAEGRPVLSDLCRWPLEEARAVLLQLPGVGRKIADCVLLFAGGWPQAFPIDVWVARALQELYFNGRRVPLRRLHEFAATHFGPWAGYAQQYLFHYRRTMSGG